MKTIAFLILSGFILFGLSSVSRGSMDKPTSQLGADSLNGGDSSRLRIEAPQDTIRPLVPESEIEDGILVENGTSSSQKESRSDTRGPGIPLFNFNGPEPYWYTVNDDVMGGVSQSLVVVDTKLQRLSFSGDVSLENNGGFASTRSQWTNYNLGAFDGIALRIRGDGNTYRFHIQTEETGSGIAYTSLFTTKAGTWQEIYIPFSTMVPLYRGFVVNAAGPLNPESIRSFGLMLTDKQEGTFSIEVDWINAVAESKYEIRYATNTADNEQILDSSIISTASS
jgi:NADH dehydrogenase [ubiquinone] 1 alpha subcomplex assembly factor 1